MASIVSVSPASGIRPASDPGPAAPRLVAGGDNLGQEPPPSPPVVIRRELPSDPEASIGGQYLSDGTLLKPVVVDPGVPDSTDRLATYTVKAGDTLYSIASHYNLSLETVMWANGLRRTLLHIGQVLVLPPVDGVVVTVGPDDTLETIAARVGVDVGTIAAYNQLIDGGIVVGETLIIPGGSGPRISLAAAQQPAAHAVVGSAGCSRCSLVPIAWPVRGGYISQRFGCTGVVYEPPYGNCRHFHAGVDIAAPAGTPIVAAAGGIVAFAGWRSNGGGYQVWISHGNGVYTAYAHMSSVAVSIGQRVGRGQRIGRVGMTGSATGPHCHFEIWIGALWGSGHPVNPLAYL